MSNPSWEEEINHNFSISPIWREHSLSINLKYKEQGGIGGGKFRNKWKGGKKNKKEGKLKKIEKME